MRKGFFITATDTSVGKTVISAAIVRALTFLGYKTAAMKPIETGCVREGKMLIPSDGMFLKSIAGMDEQINLITPCTYAYPLSPFAAGEIEGKRIKLETIIKAYNTLRKKYEVVVVEGVGGLYVPVLRDVFLSDIARQMELPVIIVTRPTLGTVNHTLLTIHYAVSKGLMIAGIIINYSSEPGADISEETNLKTLRSIIDVPIIGVFPYLSDLEEETIDRAVAKSLEINLLKDYLN